MERKRSGVLIRSSQVVPVCGQSARKVVEMGSHHNAVKQVEESPIREVGNSCCSLSESGITVFDVGYRVLRLKLGQSLFVPVPNLFA